MFYQAWLRERMLNHLASLAMSTSILKALPSILDIKRRSPSILYMASASVVYIYAINYVNTSDLFYAVCL